MSSVLFRREVLESTQDRLHGDVVLSQPLSTRLLAFALFAAVAIAGVWIALGTYARVETVPGVLVTSVPSAKAVALQSGTILDVLVEEGQSVKQGDRLVTIYSDRKSAAGGEVADRSLKALKARRQISQAQLALESTRASAERSRLSMVVTSASKQAHSLQGQIDLQEQVVSSNQDIFDRLAEVVDRGFVSKIEFERRRQTLLNSQQSLADLRQRQATALAEVRQAQARLEAVGIDEARGISQIQEGLESLAAEEARLEGEQSFVITAPISGRVTALATGQGRSAKAGIPLMVIVPDNATLLAELYAPTRAVGFVEPGKEVRLLYDAFPYQRFGSSLGQVASISRIAVDPRETEIPFSIDEPVYRVRVDLKAQSISTYGGATPLQPGMTLQANIVLERQSFLEWILQPLNAVLNRTQ